MNRQGELFDMYPGLFNDEVIRYGMSCGDGWFDIIADLCEVAKREFAKIEPEDGDDPPQVVQVKEKFGGLRFYVSTHTDVLNDAIIAAEARSFKVCHVCGGEGKCRSIGGWYNTFCDTHAKEYEERRRR